MNIHELINPVSSATTESKKRPSVEVEAIPAKRSKIEQNGTSNHTPTVGKHGLHLVPKHLKIRDIPIWAQRYPDAPDGDLRTRGGGGGDIKQARSRGTPDGPATQPYPPPPSRPSSSPLPRQWEANIIDEIPLDQISKTIADWMFANVVVAPDLGSVARWEVEAKLGHIIDQTTNQRLRIPSLTDFIVDRSNLRVAFRSTMTEGQHRSFNEFLNSALMRSLPPKDSATPVEKPRIPMGYKHTRQVDSFYNLIPEARQQLPPLTQRYVNARSRVRITKDQKTGELLAKIVKLRVDDLDILSPCGAFDVRISANIEVNYTGSIDDLVPVSEGGNPNPPRNKDRMTYNHLAYQVDLTQVTTVDVADVVSKEHELEIEMQKIDEFRQQGENLQSGRENNYVQMVNGFLDNIRLLQRQASAA